MSELTRRGFSTQALASIATFSLFDALFRSDAFGDDVKPITAKWLADVNQVGRDMVDHRLKQIQWQKKIEELFAKVDLPDLLRTIDFDRLSKNLSMPDHGARSLAVRFPQIAGIPTNFVFGRQIFAMGKGHSVVPHGHNNMATAFLILKGDFRGRHYDRVRDEPQHMIIKPTIDHAFAAGGCSTISDDKDNVHWFEATSDTGFIFNIHVTDVNKKSGKPTGRVYIDPNGEKIADGLIRGRLIDYEDANKLYG